MKKLILFEAILILFFVFAWNLSKANEKKSIIDLLDESNEIESIKEKRKIWIAECYLDAREDSEIGSDLDARLVNKHCTTLGYEKYPEPKTQFGDTITN